MQTTSLQAYFEIRDELPGRQWQVYNTLLELKKASNLDVSERLGWPINTVTPRMNELVEQGVVQESHKGKSKQTGRTVIFWEVTPIEKKEQYKLW